jgi:spore germination protein GerM
VTSLARGRVTIDLQGEGSATVGDEGPLAVGQIVLTATSVPGVDSVVLTREGKPVEAQQAGGQLTDRPLTAAEYAPLLAPR